MTNRRIAAIIQARMGSTRLPGKALIDLGGEPMLARVVKRTMRAKTPHEVVVATTLESADDAIVAFCRNHGWPCFRGSEEDVLDRYYRAAKAYGADVVVRITSDCPLIEPRIVDWVVETFLERQPEVDYACNRLPHPTFPIGLDTEVMHFSVLAKAWREDINPAWREHVTPYIYRNPSLFRILGLSGDEDRSHMRWTVDTPEDLAFVRRIYASFGTDQFSWDEVITVLQEHSDWLQINKHIPQKEVPE